MGYRHISAFSMELQTKNFFVKRGQICEKKNSEYKRIDPLAISEKQQGAYIQFINIDCCDNKQIGAFCNEYGLLSNHDIRYGRKYRGEIQELLFKMSIDDFVAEVKKFRLIVEFYCNLATIIPDLKDIKQQILIFEQNILELRKASVYNSIHFDFIISEKDPIRLIDPMDEPETISEEELLCELATIGDNTKINEYLKAIVKRHIRNYTNKIHINIDGEVQKTSETKTNAISLKGDLLSAMYFRFYLDIINDVPLKKCKDPNCKNIFAAYKRDDKLYCSARCCKNHGMREKRK